MAKRRRKKEYVNTVEAARILDVNRCTISAMLGDGRLKCVEIAPNCKRIRLSDLRTLQRSRASA